MSIDSYTIYEYNTENKTYKEIGSIDATSSLQARERFTKEAGWEASDKTCLFAKPPLCR